MKKGSKMLFAEPKSHVSKKAMKESISIAEQNGFKIKDNLKIS